LQDYLNSI